ncbi:MULTISPECIES: amidohydrolase family protein [unclassified Streptomyces]|uniref:amidohydrolase family protein n=1 Tax=unclassified Streptomyces TaxID=2593676 RepID=UPI002DD9F025|nr:MULTISPECIES: amidohydrolase family protein [unclassified Streptomyces]WSA91204.1 amidohydrolase family protein [Streptomyces sp. NBC_01795]WSB75529.1 amidohydrolase family protein [Streptomyces sp. NBC_01775]WSS16187.1 amidohydrolase family protein [Streptomyces sp. NBC_01186]WSS45006.1 amidohydrolase family protein [Streptomyces sp. NBC_01187]
MTEPLGAARLPGAEALFDFRVRLRPTADAAAGLLAAMDAHGIRRAVVTPGGTASLARISRQFIEGGGVTDDADNGAALAVCRAHHERLVPCYFASPHNPDAYAAEGKLHAAVEISPAVHGVPLSDPRTAALAETAERTGHSVYTVCLPLPGSGVADLVRLAADFPSVTFVMGHCGIGNIDVWGLSLVRESPNVLVETSGGYTVTLRAALDELGSDRVLFGSEYPLQDPGVELAKVAALGLDSATLSRITWENAHRILGEDLV